MLKIEVKQGERVIEKVQAAVRQWNIKNAAIVSVIGAVKTCTISNMHPENSAEDFVNTYKEQLELSGSGEVIDGKVHIHCVVSRSGAEALAGHLQDAVVGDHFVHVYLIALDS